MHSVEGVHLPFEGYAPYALGHGWLLQPPSRMLMPASYTLPPPHLVWEGKGRIYTWPWVEVGGGCACAQSLSRHDLVTVADGGWLGRRHVRSSKIVHLVYFFETPSDGRGRGGRRPGHPAYQHALSSPEAKSVAGRFLKYVEHL